MPLVNLVLNFVTPLKVRRQARTKVGNDVFKLGKEMLGCDVGARANPIAHQLVEWLCNTEFSKLDIIHGRSFPVS